MPATKIHDYWDSMDAYEQFDFPSDNFGFTHEDLAAHAAGVPCMKLEIISCIYGMSSEYTPGEIVSFFTNNKSMVTNLKKIIKFF